MMRALIISANEDALAAITCSLTDGYEVDTAGDKVAGLERFRSRRNDLTFLDLSLLGGFPHHVSYDDELMAFWDIFPAADIVAMTSNAHIREAVKAVKAGASHFLAYPIDPEELQYAVDSLHEAIKRQSELDYLRDEFWKSDVREEIRTESPVMREVVRKIRLVAPTRSTVLLSGETGTGKSMLAKIIHSHSNRSESQFVSVHCGAIPDSLLESELFGHEKGAFTGATQRVLGKFEIANGGTILLDEIGTLSASAQIKLLQVLQDRTLQRIGSETAVEVDVRVIAATNEDLKDLCRRGEFRQDLYYRLNVFPIEVPPLRERREDVPFLTKSFIRSFNRTHVRDIKGVHPAVMPALQHYGWPGNVRELENLIERAFILEDTSVLGPASFPSEIFANLQPVPEVASDTRLTLEEARRAGIDEIERRYLEAQLAAARGRIDRAAGSAGITPRQLHKLMRKYGLHKEDYKQK